MDIRWVVGGAVWILFLLTMTGILINKDTGSFSSWLLDVYKPSGGFIIEKAPVRIIFFGESDKQITSKEIIEVINALEKIEFNDYQFNHSLTIQVDSNSNKANNRSSNKMINIKLLKEIN